MMNVSVWNNIWINDTWLRHYSQGKGLNLDLFANQYLFQKRLLSPTLENHKHPIDSHCKKFNSLILSCHTWNIPKKYPSRIYKQWKSDLDTSWEFPILEIGEFFWMNTDLWIDPNLICSVNLCTHINTIFFSLKNLWHIVKCCTGYYCRNISTQFRNYVKEYTFSVSQLACKLLFLYTLIVANESLK